MFFSYVFTFNQRRSPRYQKSLGLLALLLLLSGCNRNGSPSAPAPSIPPATINTGVKTSYAGVVEQVSPAVVTIRTEARVRAARQFPFMDDPFFRRFFGIPGQQQSPELLRRGLGSGVIVSADGYILTNFHVIDGAEQIEIALKDRRTADAKVIGSDAPSDLAVLKIDEGNLTPLALANSDQVQVGDLVLAVGNPLGIGQTVTMGIISAKGRSTGLSNGSFEDFLQTDAPINQGNSGGALVSSTGSLIGINSQILSPSGGSIGIGFAIPSNMAREVFDQLVKSGSVRRGHLGIGVQLVTEDIARSLGLQNVKGIIVSQVDAASAGERAGLKRGDVILGLNGNAVTDPNMFRNSIASTSPGSTVSIRILRDGNEQEVKATLGELVPDERTNRSTDNKSTASPETNNGALGLAVEPLSPTIAQQLGIHAQTEGLLVRQVDPSGPAADAGIEGGDVIEQANQQTLRSIADLRAAIERSGNKPVLLLVNHRGTSLFVTVRPRPDR
jgi:serine protease Do